MFDLKFKLVSIATVAVVAAGCTSSPVYQDTRNPAGTGDIESSENGISSLNLESYKIPLKRNGKALQKVAYNFWSGEWPGPVLDVNSTKSGETTISAYTNLRNPQPSDRISCTIKNGVYHPWSTNDPSNLTYYTLTDSYDFKVVKTFKYDPSATGSTGRKITIPKGAQIINMVYYGENLCGAILKVGKNMRPISNECPFFTENKNLEKVTTSSMSDENRFAEQWLYLSCQEKDKNGKNIKAFVQDTDLLEQPGVARGCPKDYGTVGGAEACRE